MTQLVYIDNGYKYGFHVSKFPTLERTVQEKIKSPTTAMQLYIGNPRSFSFSDFDINDIIKAKELIQRYGIYTCIHGSLTNNPAGKDYVLKNTREGLTTELDIGAGIGAGVVVHIGTNPDKSKGIGLIAETIVHVLAARSSYTTSFSKAFGMTRKEFRKRRLVILENAAGEGNKIGSNLKEIAEIYKRIPNNLKPQVKVCIDTAHAYGAGLYDWGIVSEVERFYTDFDKIIGLDHLGLFHLNDSRCSDSKGKNAFFGSHKDRHENLGLGYVFSDDINPLTDKQLLSQESRCDGLKKFLLMARKHSIPIIGEPPKDGEGGRRDWGYACMLMSETEYPIEIITEFEPNQKKKKQVPFSEIAEKINNEL